MQQQPTEQLEKGERVGFSSVLRGLTALFFQVQGSEMAVLVFFFFVGESAPAKHPRRLVQ
jgi:hypothetical protein